MLEDAIETIKTSKHIKKDFKEIFKKNNIEQIIKNIIDAKYLKLSSVKYDGIIFKANKKMRIEYNQDKENVPNKILDTLVSIYNQYYKDNIDRDVLSLLFDISVSNMGDKNFIIVVNLY